MKKKKLQKNHSPSKGGTCLLKGGGNKKLGGKTRRSPQKGLEKSPGKSRDKVFEKQSTEKSSRRKNFTRQGKAFAMGKKAGT